MAITSHGKTPLFSRLQRLARSWQLERSAAAQAGVPVQPAQPNLPRGGRLSRRELGGALGLVLLPSACRSEESIAVVGAGLAGLHAALRLEQAGLRPVVYEASARIGGRTWTGRGLFQEAQSCELGGELIDTNHRFIWALAEEFGLELTDRQGGDDDVPTVDTWIVSGERVSEEEIVHQFRAVLPQLAASAKAADEDEGQFSLLDETNLRAYLNMTVPSESYPELHAVLVAAYRGEFGLEVEEQSALNLIYLIGSDNAETFRIFGDSDERYHIKQGNDALAAKLREGLREAVRLEHRLVQARKVGQSYELAFESKDGRKTESFARVIFALPFTTLRKLRLQDLGLSQEKRTIIEQLGYGTNAKIMGGFQQRVWMDAGENGSVTSDGELQQTWDSSVGQPGRSGILTQFLGGVRGMKSAEGSPDARFKELLPELDQIFPGAESAYTDGSAVRMHWPTYEHSLGSYTCYRPGQWKFWGREGLPEGRLYFCGEHTSAEFQGWMEGAAETGARVAAELLHDLGLPFPSALRELIDEQTLLPGEKLMGALFPKRLAKVRARRN